MKRVWACLLAVLILCSLFCAPAVYADSDELGQRLYGGDTGAISDSDLAAFIEGYEGNRVSSGMRAEELYVDHYDIDMTINSLRTVSVVETLHVMFNEEMHGFQRYIPMYGAEEMYRITNVEASGDIALIERDSDVVYVRLGSENRTVEGMMEYVISYDIEYYNDITANGDRIYQNIFPTDLDNYVRNATARIRMPEGAELLDYRMYSGIYGATDSGSISRIVSDGVMYLYSNKYFSPDEGATVELLFPEGTFKARPADLVVRDAEFTLDVERNGSYTFSQRLNVRVDSNAVEPTLPVWQKVWMDDDDHDIYNHGTDQVRTAVAINGSAVESHKGAAACIPLDLNAYRGENITVTSVQKGNFEVAEGEFELVPVITPIRGGGYSPTEYSNIVITFNLQSPDGEIYQIQNKTWTGSESTEYYFATTETENGYTARLKGTLPVGESVYSRAQLPVSAIERGTTWLDWVVLAIGCVLLVCTLFFRSIRAEKTIIPSMEYYPPNNMNPAEIGYIIDGKADSHDLTSLIYYWASHGHLTIEMTGKTKYTLHKMTELDDEHQDYERVMFRRLWALGDGMDVTSSRIDENFYSTLAKATIMLKNSFDKTSRRLFDKTSEQRKNVMFFAGLAASVIVPLMAAKLAPASSGSEFVSVILAVLFFLPMAFIADYKWKSTQRRKPFARVMLNIGMIALAVIAVLIYPIMFSLVAVKLLIAYFFTIAVAVTVILAPGIRKRTPYCTSILGRCLGFKLFIENAEKDRLEMLIEESPDYYYNILPYAQVLGVSDVWKDKFAGMQTEPPSWFYGADVTSATVNHLMLRNMTRMNTNMRSMPVQSGSGSSFGGFSGGGGSFGGGFSGGGGGGGGGGGW